MKEQGLGFACQGVVTHDVYHRTAILFGILYLAFQAWPIIFGVQHGFSLQNTGMAFIGIGIGMTVGCIANVALIR